MYHINISTIHASWNVLRKNRPLFPHSSQLWATQADRLGLEMLRPASDSLEFPRGLLESARRSLGEVGNTVGKTLSQVLSLLSCSGKTHEEGCWISKINNPLCSQAFQADSEGYVYFNFLYLINFFPNVACVWLNLGTSVWGSDEHNTSAFSLFHLRSWSVYPFFPSPLHLF